VLYYLADNLHKKLQTDKVKLPKEEQKYLPPELHVLPEPEQTEEEKWLESLETVTEHALKDQGPQKTARFLDGLTTRLRARGVEVPRVVSTPYINTIPADEQAPFPGDWEMERRIKSFVRWNAMAMVVNANREHSGLGGHISTYASAATLCEVGFNHFFRGRTGISPGTWCISRGTRRRGSTRGRFWRDGWRSGICITSDRSWRREAGCRPTHIRI